MAAGQTGCVVVGAGSGTRLAAGLPKAFVEVAGRTLLDHAVHRVRACGDVVQIVLVVPADRVAAVSEGFPDAAVVAGGASRQESVLAGVAALPGSVDVVLVHDAARALTPAATFTEVAGAVRAGHRVVVPAVPLHDTVRSLSADGGASVLVDRTTLRAVQTPQGFARDVLEQAHAATRPGGAPATDDATLAERAGHPVLLVEGSPEAFKVTRPVDLLLAEAVLARGAASPSPVTGPVGERVTSPPPRTGGAPAGGAVRWPAGGAVR